ncbi:hypothetical protein L1049_015583 [Liquidambar formosana]|uniref:AB hydrolase-1 domain-containing protein n=1 Tax=Liquidambar formosana TaxID=63359 RepID=A0AAP0RYB0_LIQFO
MVNIIASIYKPLLQKVMKLAGVRPQTVEIEPGTVMNFWVPTEPTRKSKNHKETSCSKQNKPALVLLHGFAVDGILTWQFQVPSLTSKYAVYVPDLLFFGGSHTDRAERSTEFQAECVAKGLMKLGVERCMVVGFSYGGMIGFKMAKLYPDLVESMVVSCSVLALTESITADCLERIGFNCWSDFLLPNSAEGIKVMLSIGSCKLPWLPNCFYEDYLEVMFNHRKEKGQLLEALVIKDKDFTVPHFSQRIHLLWGENDKIFNMESAHNLKRQLGDKTTLKSIEKAGHLAQLDRPCVYNRCLKKILASLESDGHGHQE